MDLKHRAVNDWQLQAIVKRRADSMGLSVEFDRTGKQAHCQNIGGKKHITLPFRGYPMKYRDSLILKALYIHECIHATRDRWYELMDGMVKASKDPTKELLKFKELCNLVEDTAMEREHSKKFAGDKLDLGAGLACVVEDLANSISSFDEDHLSNPDFINHVAAMMVALESRRDWDSLGTMSNNKLLNAIPEEAKQLYAELEQEGWVDKLRPVETPDEVFAYTKELYERLYPDEEQLDRSSELQQVESGQSSPSTSTAVHNGDSECKGGVGEEAEQVNEGRDRDNEGDEDGIPTPRTEFQKIPWHKLRLSHDKDAAPDESTAGMSIDWDGYDEHDYNSWTPASLETLVEIDLKREQHKSNPNSKFLANNLEAQILANQVRRHIQIQTRKKIQTEKMEGKLHKRNTYRVAIGNQEWNRRIFKKRVDGLEIDTAVSVLVDWSGSMCGDKMEVASQAGARILKVFDQSLHVPTELLSFTSSYSEYQNGIVKAFNDKSYTDEDIAQRFTRFKYYSGGNHDPDALCWAAHRLLARDEKRKILIVLSDGNPTCAEDGYADAGLKMVTEDLQSRPDMELYGIGIMDTNVRRYYGDNARVINRADELDEVLLDTLKEAVTYVPK